MATVDGVRQPSGRPAWIHPKLVNPQHINRRRKIHLDFHNSQHVEQVAHEFDADEFVKTLCESHVDSIVVFAKDMHGYAYYPSEIGPMHPGLSGRDLLAKQVAACRSAGISVYAYYCTTWDNYLAETRPEWLSITRERRSYLPRFDETPSWTALCLSNEGFVEHMLGQTREVMEAYGPDGMWYDQPVPNRDNECFCQNCLKAIRSRGMDPLDSGAQTLQMEAIFSNWLQRSEALVRALSPGAITEQNMQARLGLGHRAQWLANVDIEALPTGMWGYSYFPVMSRYVRGLGIPMTGMTGRFHLAWADFGGLKSRRQLTLEVAAIVATGAAVTIGDQPPPSGRLDPAVYRAIGAAYGHLDRLDSFLAGAVGISEAALYIAGRNMVDFGLPDDDDDGVLSESIHGAVRLLTEQRIQFDIIEALTESLSRYRLVLVPDGIILSEAMTAQLEEFVSGGGQLISFANPVGGMPPLWMQGLGIVSVEAAPVQPAFFRPASDYDELASDFDYVVYDGAYRWEVEKTEGVRTLATLSEAEYARTPERFTSHAQWPVSEVSDRPVVLASSTVAAFGFALGRGYFQYGYWPYSATFAQAVEHVLAQRVVRASGPSTLEVSVTEQAVTLDRPRRRLVHLVNFSGVRRRSAGHLEYHEESVPIMDVELQVEVDGTVSRVLVAPDGPELPFEARGDRTIVFCVPIIDLHEVVSIEFAEGAVYFAPASHAENSIG